MRQQLNYGFCLQRGEKCGYCGGSPCDYSKLNVKPYSECFEYTVDAKRILRNIKDIEVLEELGYQIFSSKGKEFELILDTCYFGKNKESSIEHLKKLYCEEYTTRKLFN